MQSPLEHFGTPLFEVMTAHALPHVPQLAGSAPVLTHMFVAGHAVIPELVLQVPLLHD